MKEDIIKFRRIALCLIQEGKHTQESIMNNELKVSFPTIYKLLQEDIQSIRVRSSVLGKIQDFNKKYNLVLSYEGIEGVEAIEELIQSQTPIPEKSGEKPIDRVTTTLLDIALRSVGIQMDLDLIDKIIDLVELLEDKGGEATILDICKIQAEWDKPSERPKRPEPPSDKIG